MCENRELSARLADGMMAWSYAALPEWDESDRSAEMGAIILFVLMTVGEAITAARDQERRDLYGRMLSGSHS